MAELSYFTALANFKAIVADTPDDGDADPDLTGLTGTVTFTAALESGDLVLATGLTAGPTGLMFAPIQGCIDSDGIMKLGYVDSNGDVQPRTTPWGAYSYTPVRLVADTATLELEEALWYNVTFSNMSYNGKFVSVNGFSFQAPNGDIEFDLIENALPGPGVDPTALTKIAPAGVRIEGDTLVFTFGGVDIPDPVPLERITLPDYDNHHAAQPKTTPVDADEIPLADSADSYALKKLTWANLKATLGAWYDTATRTLTNKTLDWPTLTNPKTTILRDPSTLAAWASHNYESVYLSPEGRPALQVGAEANSVNYARITGRVAGVAPTVGVSGTDTNVSLNLTAKGSGTVQANGVPVVTTSGTAALTNKTISGLSNTVTNLPASATPNVTREAIPVFAPGQSGCWTKLLSYDTTGGYTHCSILMHINAEGQANAASATLLFGCTTQDGVGPYLQLISVVGPTGYLAADSFKAVRSGTDGPIELWLWCNTNVVNYRVYESVRYYAAGKLTWGTGSVWQAEEPVGTDYNVRTSEVVTNGNMLIGNRTSTPTATPQYLSLGATYGTNTAGSPANMKLRLYDTANPINNSAFGFGISASRLEYQAAGTHSFYATGSSTELFSIGTSGVKVGGVDVVTTTGAQTLTNKTLTNPTITGYTESVVAIGTVNTSHTLSLANGTVQTATLTASTACTFTMPTATAGQSFSLFLKQAASTGNGTATFTGVKWNGDGAPTITATAGTMDILSFVSDGTNWYGSYTQGYTP